MSRHDWKIFRYGDIGIYYKPEIDGGGMYFAKDFVDIVKARFGKVNYLCEFGCGPGFIGFALLTSGLCKKLCLTDINPLAIEACVKTIKENGLRGKVTTYVSETLKTIPEKEKWDLVVSNPPHSDGLIKDYRKDLINIDPGFRIHREFYKNVPSHLSNHGSVLFVENFKGSDTGMWKMMAVKNGLSVEKIFVERRTIFKLVRVLASIALSLPWYLKKSPLAASTNRKLMRVSNRMIDFIYPHYYVWSKKR